MLAHPLDGLIAVLGCPPDSLRVAIGAVAGTAK